MAGSRSLRGWALALTAVGFFMVTLDGLVVITALPAMHSDLGGGVATLEWTVNAYNLAYAAGIITAAALGDRYGRRRLFTLGLFLFSAASAICALSPNVQILIAARVLQGTGAAIVMPLSLTLLTTAFPAERRGAVIGIWGSLGSLGVAIGPLIGGAVTQGLNWHWIFWLNVPIGLVAGTLALVRLTESYGPATRLDLPAVALVTGGAVGLVWGLVRGNDAGWGSPEVVLTLGLGLLLMVGFVLWERRAAAPMLPLRLFRSRAFSAASVTAFLMNATLIGAIFLTSQFFQIGLGVSPLGTGLRLLPWSAMPVLVAPVAGRLSDRYGQRPLLVAGMLLQGIGLGWFALLATSGAGYGALVLPLILAGVGIAMAFAMVPAAMLGAVAPADTGKASGVNSTLQRFGGVFGVAVASAVFAANGHFGTAASFSAGFRPAVLVAASFSVAGAISALAIRGRRQIRPATTTASNTGEHAPVAEPQAAGSR